MSNATRTPVSFQNPPKNRFWAAMRRGLGDRYFVRTFWRLLTPTLIWGVLISIVPILFNSVTKLSLNYSFFPSAGAASIGIHGDLSTTLNYTYEEFSTVNYLATIFIFSFFPAIGNYFGHKNYEDFKQTMRFAMYLSMASSLIMFICYEACAQGYIEILVFDGTSVGQPSAQEELGIYLTRPMSFIVFSFAWQWIYIPALSSIKNNRPLIYSAILGIVFYIVVDVSYLYGDIRPNFISAIHDQWNAYLSVGDTTTAAAGYLSVAPSTMDTKPFAVEEQAATGEGIIYTVYFFLQPMFVYFYLKFFRSIQIMWFAIKGPAVYWNRQRKGLNNQPTADEETVEKANEYYAESNYHIEMQLANPLDDLYDGWRVSKKQIEIIKQTHYFEKDVLFFDKLSVRRDLMKAVVMVGLGNIVDQTLFNAIEIIHFYYAIHYSGSFDPAAAGTIDGLPVMVGPNNPAKDASAAHHYFKLLVYVPEQMVVFFYGIWNAFFVVPQFFVARELGMKHKDIAKHNAWVCMNWAYLISFVLMIMIWIFSSFINEYVTYVDTVKNANGTINTHAYYAFKHGKVMYWYLWEQSRNIMLYFGVLQITYTSALMAMPIVVVGASKWIVFSDTVGTTLFTIIGVILNKTHFDGVVAYWFIVHLDKLFKYSVFMIIMLTGQALNSIHDVGKNSLISKQWKIFNNPFSPKTKLMAEEATPPIEVDSVK